MGNSCHNSTKANGSKSRLGWWLLGGFVVVIGGAWAFQGNPLVNFLAPLLLGGLVLIWFAMLVMRRIGVRR